MVFFKRLIRTKLFLPILLSFVTAIVSSVIFFFGEVSINDGVNNIFDALWWSIITMSTTGYGDVVPSTVFSKIIAAITIILGILATSLLTGTIASVYLNQISMSRSGLMTYNKLKGHIIICGWRNGMVEFLLRIVKYTKISAGKIIVVADPSQELVDAVFETSGLSEFKFVRGSFYDKSVLEKTNVTHAKKAIVLSDQSANATAFEVDSRTVMTVISLKTLNKNLHVSAQLLEKNFEVYLQRAKCDEIIFSKALNTDLLSLIVKQEGMSNVLTAIVGPEEGNCHLSIEPIKPNLIDKSFSELKEYFLKNKTDIIILGILENTGKQHEITAEAIRHAQQTANFPKMLENLQKVQGIKPFKPVMIPRDDYIISRHSSVILLEKNHA